MIGRGIVVRAVARSDIDAHVVWLREEAGFAIANQFVTAIHRSFMILAETPGLGAPLSSNDPQLAAIRKWKVAGFPNHLIFYEPMPDGVVVARVLHAAQDWWELLEVE